jgi:hypothetical protein
MKRHPLINEDLNAEPNFANSTRKKRRKKIDNIHSNSQLLAELRSFNVIDVLAHRS